MLLAIRADATCLNITVWQSRSKSIVDASASQKIVVCVVHSHFLVLIRFFRLLLRRLSNSCSRTMIIMLGDSVGSSGVGRTTGVLVMNEVTEC